MVRIKSRLLKFSFVFSLVLLTLLASPLVLGKPPASIAAGIPQNWQANQYKPPSNIGAPGRTEQGGTRSPDTCPVGEKRLTALIPNNRFGVTTTGYPTFYVYMPPSPSRPAEPPNVEFLLQDEEGNEVYKANFRSGGGSGFLSVGLPDNGGLMPLSVGKNYQWFFSIVCNPIDRSSDRLVKGWVRRVELSPSLDTQLKQSSPQKQADLYADSEVWYDAISALATARRANLNDPAIAAQWQRLLTSAELQTLAQEPFFQ